jgi:hypothetical protein
MKAIPGSVVGCAESIINRMVFNRFRFFTYLVDWMIQLAFGWLFNSFLCALDSLFLIFEGLGSRSENQ